MTIKEDVKALQKELKTLEKKIANLAKAIKPIKKSQTPNRSKTESTPAQAIAGKTSGKTTATDRVLDVIEKAESGVDTASLMKETGFKATKVRNILSRMFKEGKIKRAGRGIYVSA